MLRWPGNFVHFLYLLLVFLVCGLAYGLARLAIAIAAWGPRRQRAVGHLRGWILRQGMSSLGATFIKLGQVMSTRPDLFSPEVIGSLRQLLSAESSRCLAQSGIGPARYAILQAAVELARRHFREALRVGPALAAPDATRTFLLAQLRDRPYEVFCCLYLDNRHRLIAFEELFRGTIDRAGVHPREVLRQTLLHNAAAVILAHNHPSGVLEPSQADELITRRLKEALALVDVRVLDHFIIGDGHCYSFAEAGRL